MKDIIYLSIDQANDLVDRIADRAENFNYYMTDAEKDAMACRDIHNEVEEE